MDRKNRLQRYQDAGPRSNDILFAVFVIYGVCNTLFISYVAVEHKVQRDESVTKTKQISDILNDLKIPNSAYDCLNGRDSCKEITQMITKLQNCERSRAIIRLMKQQMDQKRQYLKMWDNVPKPFIQAEMKAPNITDGKLRGWNTTAEIQRHCEGVDPAISCDKGCIEVKVDGRYYIYSQVTFQCPSQFLEKGKLHRHSTKVLRNETLVLMTNSYQLCGRGEEGKLKVSYHSGIYQLHENDQLMVAVEKPSTTKLFVDDDYHNDDLFFGAYLV